MKATVFLFAVGIMALSQAGIADQHFSPNAAARMPARPYRRRRRSREAAEEKRRTFDAELRETHAALREKIAEQQMLVMKLDEVERRLLQLDNTSATERIAASIAHQINNPVGFVNSNLGTLRRYADKLLGLLAVYEHYDGLLPDEARRMLEGKKADLDIAYLRNDLPQLLDESAEGLQRIKRMVEDLKNFSRPDETGWQLANLERELETTLRVLSSEIKCKAEVVTEFGGIPNIECRTSQINQVFASLLVNAAEAMEQPGRITLRTGTDAQNVWVKIADTGKGIVAEHLPCIFEPFFTTKPAGKGTGLGLSISHRIVKRHGGRIDVASELNRGTTFSVILPIKAPSRDNRPDAAAQFS